MQMETEVKNACTEVAEQTKAKKLVEEIKPIVTDGSLGDRDKADAITKIVFAQQFYGGPLPQAEEMERYNRIIPNGADRIMTLAEKQAEHRRSLESKVIPGQMRQGAVGQWMGFIIAILVLGAGIYSLYLGETGVAKTIFAVTIIGLVALFLRGKSVIRRDNNDKSALKKK